MIQTIQQYLQFPFVRYALVVGTLIALCSSLLGVTLVLKRFSFIGDGLSHVAFGAMAIAGVLRINNDMLFVMPVTVLCAVLLLRTGQNAKIRGDAAVAMISVGALALGYLMLNLFVSWFASLIVARKNIRQYLLSRAAALWIAVSLNSSLSEWPGFFPISKKRSLL